MSTKVLTLLVCSAILVLTVAGISGAAQITTSATYGPATTDWMQTLALSQFDPALGTLNFVMLEISETLNCTLGLENLAKEATSVTASFWGTVTVKQGASTLGSATAYTSRSFNLQAFDNNLDWGGASGLVDNTMTAVGSSGPILIDSGLDFFKGTGTISLDAISVANSKTEGTGNIASYYMTNATATAKITYDFTPVPEPATMSVLATGFAGLALLRRRRG